MAAEETEPKTREGEEKELSDLHKENPPDRPEIETFVT